MVPKAVKLSVTDGFRGNTAKFLFCHKYKKTVSQIEKNIFSGKRNDQEDAMII